MKILSIDGFKKFEGFSRKKANMVKINFENGKNIKVALDHQFMVPDDGNEWRKAGDLQVGDMVMCGGEKNQDGDRNCIVPVKIVGVEDGGEGWVYTPIDVAGGGIYLGGAAGAVSHNCSFLGSSSTLIDGDTLDQLMSKDPEEYKYGYDMAIYERPMKGYQYVMGVDTAMGNAGDYSTIQVLKVEGKNRFRQVACYRRNTIGTDEFAEVVAAVAEWYMGALYIVENNDLGRLVADRLFYDIGSPGMISTDKRGGLGTRANKGTKLEACKTLKQMLERKALEVVDQETIAELSRFEEVAPNVYRAQKGKHDDLVSALYWACYCLLQPEVGLDGLEEQYIDRTTRSETSNMDIDDGPMPMAMEGAFLGRGSMAGLGDDFWAGLN